MSEHPNTSQTDRPPSTMGDQVLSTQGTEADQERILNPINPDILPLLDPEFVAYYNKYIGPNPATHQVPFNEVRSNPEKWRGKWCIDYTGEPGVGNLSIPSKDGYQIPMRTYSPDSSIWGPGPYPVHVNFHGGGNVFGDLTVDAKWCMKLTERVGVVVVDVDYRLCPESVFGKNIEDGWAALTWVHGKGASELNVNSQSISIGGISAGGGLCCTLQHMARDAGIPLKMALLSVPTTDYTTYFPFPEGYTPFPSVAALAKVPSLGADRIEFFRRMVFPEEHKQEILQKPISWRAPLHSPSFKGLCDAFIAVAQCDPLVDEGEAYGRKIIDAGGKVTFRRYQGMPHPFMHMELKAARLYDDDLCAALKQAHTSR